VGGRAGGRKHRGRQPRRLRPAAPSASPAVRTGPAQRSARPQLQSSTEPAARSGRPPTTCTRPAGGGRRALTRPYGPPVAGAELDAASERGAAAADSAAVVRPRGAFPSTNDRIWANRPPECGQQGRQMA